jgi:hypothetical protein
VGVIFPVPGRTSPYEVLVKCLQDELQATNCESAFCSRDTNGVPLWVLTLGSIAATSMSDQTWFVATLGRFAARSALSKWQHVERLLEPMPWLDNACRSARQKLRDEIDHLVGLR